MAVNSVQAQPANGPQAKKRAGARNQVQARNGVQGNVAGRNGAQRNQGVQMLLQRFDANGNGALEGDELVRLAAAIQQMMMVRMGQQAGGFGGRANGMGQGFGNQGAMGRGNGQGFGQAGRQGFGHGGGGFGGGHGGGGARGGGR
jgi:hypothetical protein